MDFPDLGAVKKILVIKLRSLGDVLLSTALFPVLKDRLPQALIDVYVYEEARGLLEGNPFLNGIMTFDQKCKKQGFWARGKKELELLQKIRKQKYDLVINLTEGDRGAIAALVSRAFLRLGLKGGKLEWAYTHLTKI
ncbi:MAG: glycosyltransferase family 9 protein, partial [Parachlamydiales bacterium]